MDGATSTSYTVTGLEAGPHTFTVRAIDAAGNLSTPSDPGHGERARHGQAVRAERPERHRRRPARWCSPGPAPPTTWASPATGSTGTARRSAATLGNLTTFTHTNLQSGNSDYTVRAIDAAGNLSDPSNTATVNIPDAEKPTAPWWLRANRRYGPGRG